ncbi:MAG: hypothetical protein M4579_005345 [Chaenotheca gracillima]|nr:MAG: hypothetical protein M4579_005345 [Chaenotheca gracillima]
MTHNQNAYVRYDHSQPPPPPRPRPQVQSHSSERLRRTPSFETGDDGDLRRAADPGDTRGYSPAGMSQGNGIYRSDTTAGRQDAEMFMGSQTQPGPPPTRQSTYGPALSGYRHQYSAPSPPSATPSSYNPQNFARTQSMSQPQPQTSPSTYNGLGVRYAAAAPAPAPYNPALYQTASSGYTQNSYGSPNLSSGMPSNSPGSTPSLPSRSPLPQSNQGYSPDPGYRVSQYTTHMPQHQPQYSPALPPQASSAPPHPQAPYAPPAPPPPPVPPASPDESRRYSGNARSDSQARHHVQSNSQSSYQQSSNPLPSPPVHEGSNRSSSHASWVQSHSVSPNQEASSPLPSPPAPTPPQHSPQRTSTLGRHPQARPLPQRPPDPMPDDNPEEVNSNGQGGIVDDEALAQESIWREVEAAVMDPRPVMNSQQRSPRIDISDESPMEEEEEPQALFSNSPGRTLGAPNDRSTNGYVTATGAGQYVNYNAYSDESDAEAAMGMAAMQMAEEQDAIGGNRFASSGPEPSFSSYDRPSNSRDPTRDTSSDSDYATVDMDSMEGGHPGQISYGADPNLGLGRPYSGDAAHRRYGSRDSGQAGLDNGVSTRSTANNQRDDYEFSIPDQDEIHPFRSFNVARVDTFGTGGLAEPGANQRKMSFDEGDERSWDAYVATFPEGRSPSKEEYPEMFYHPGRRDRPLPPVPSPSSDSITPLPSSGTADGSFPSGSASSRPSYPVAPDAYGSQLLAPNGLPVPRSSSLASHSSAAQMVAPIRSKTDAEEQRRSKLFKQQQLGIYASVNGSEAGFDPLTPESAVALDLPSLPVGKRKKFAPNKLSTTDFKKCSEPWALSSVASWLKELSEGETDLREKTVIDGIVALFTHKVPTMNIADAETLSARVLSELFLANVLVHEEEWVKFGSGKISGVLWQLTGTGCYAPRLHTQDMPGRCYSHHCSRTLKKVNLQTQLLEPQRKLQDWATFYRLKKEDVENVTKKEIERQNNLHEIVQTEDQFMDHLNVLRVLYRDQLMSWQPSIISPKRLGSFTRDVFGKVDAVKSVNEDFLLAQLKYRQQEQGPWISGFSDIFREWVRKARDAYIDYAAVFPNATLLVRKEAESNILFRQFLDQARDNERSKRLGWDTYLKAPITRLTRYGLLLTTVYKNMPSETEEKINLATAIEEVKTLTLECDARYAEMSKKVDLLELSSKLVLRPGMERVELNLNHLGRELIFEGDLQRTGSNRFTWLETHAILFDHYFVLAKTVHHRDSVGGVKQERYDVSKIPIPMDLLVFESQFEEPVVKSSVPRIGGVSTVASKTPTAAESRRAGSSSGPGTLTHTSTESSINTLASNASGKTMVTNTVLEGPKDEKTMYPFRVKHLGQDVYTLYAPTAANRTEWCIKILEAKRKHAASLFAQNAEPFRLRVMADTAFGYDGLSGGPKSNVIPGTPLDRAVRDVEKIFEKAGPRPTPICRAAVNCATAFNQPYGKSMVAVGTDYGVYISPVDNPRGWSKAISATRVTQIAVLEEFSIFLVISDRALIAYHLDVVCPVSGAPQGNDSARKAPQKLSGSREVGFFATGRMKDRTLVFYKKREGISSTFKVLEPVYQKATEKKSRFSRKGNTEFFREFDEFYIPSECFDINLFHSSLAISTARGFEILTLDKKNGQAVPDLKQPHVSSIAARLSGQRPLGMFRLNDTEFLLCYEECAVYVNKHGDVSRSVIMEFVGKAKNAAMYGPYVLLFDADFVEIRNAENGRLRQVIAGRDVKCLDDALSGGSSGQRTLKISLQHPEIERTQLVVELLLNEGQRD